MSSFLELDGSEGEGGGQILRSSLALSILTRRPFRLINIRANRSKPGLAAQHLASVRAAAAICNGIYKGGSIGSSTLFFEPGDVCSGEYSFSIGTAGATSLVLHTVYLPLILQGKVASRITISGGTHVEHSPCYHFLETTWTAYLRKLGVSIELEMTRPGFYPRGGGEIVATIHPAVSLRPVSLMRPAVDVTTLSGFSAVADLPQAIAKRQAKRLRFRMSELDLEFDIPEQAWSNGPSTCLAVIFRQAPVPTLFSALGARGKPAETVADEAADQAIAYYNSGAPVDPHSADQIVLPLAFAAGTSEFRVSEVTMHLLTNIATIRKFCDRIIECDGDLGNTGHVRIV